MSEDGPVFPAAPPERIDLPDGLALVRTDADRAAALTQSINESLDHLAPWMAWASEPTTEPVRAAFLAGAEALWDARRDFGYLIIESETDRVVGGSGLHGRLDEHGLEIGYWVHVDWIGRGVATNVSRALTDAAFGIPGIDRVRITMADDNLRSARVPAKLGYEYQGTWVPDTGPCSGRPTQHWEITRDAWVSAGQT